MTDKPNIILIIIDALRARNLGCYGYDKPTSPNIDEIAGKGVLFENAYCCINCTDPSLTSILTSRFPASHGLLHHPPHLTQEEIDKVRHIPFLQEILKKNGYRTHAVDWLGGWRRRGYDYYSGIITTSKKPIIGLQKLVAYTRLERPLFWLKARIPGWERIGSSGKSYDAADAVTNQALNIIHEQTGKPFFLFLHYWDTHFPYVPPKGYRDKFYRGYDYDVKGIDKANIGSKIGNPTYKQYVAEWLKVCKDVKEVLCRYDGTVNFVDDQVGRLIEGLKKNGILDNTILIVTADHGESLLEHEIYFEHHGLYEPNIQVPLIIVGPGVFSSGKRVSGFVQHIDLMPTILDLLNIPGPDRMQGESLLNFIHGDKESVRDYIFVEEAMRQRKRALSNGPYKYIMTVPRHTSRCSECWRVHGGEEELYDLVHDPEEKKNMVNELPEIASKMRLELISLVKKLENSSPD